MRLVRFMLIMMIGDDAYHCVIISNLVDDDSVDNWCAGFSVSMYASAFIADYGSSECWHCEVVRFLVV